MDSLALQLLVTAACAAVLSALLTRAALAYARRRGMLDQPGRRRSHTHPTPRGGGAGLIAAVLAVGMPAWWLTAVAPPRIQLPAFAIALLAVALVGWRDDRQPLPVAPRFAIHIAAALLAAAAALAPAAVAHPVLWWLLLPLAPVLAGFINAHNFMDGIDGILGQQGLFVLAGLGALALAVGANGVPALAFATAAACLGFLCFNAPPARIFMGDVGSGALGLAIGGSAALVVQHDPATFWACAILPSAFLVDSGLTLARRICAGERWYTPHRQHLYQWLVRVNWTHARTDIAYMTWNLVVVAPLAALAAWRPHSGAWFAAIAYAASVLVWFVGKRTCLARIRRGVRHASA